NSLQFATNSAIGMTLDTLQHLGIGTTAPNAMLDVRGSIIAGSGTGDATIASQGANKLMLQTNGTAAITALNGGNACVGVTAPVSKLDVNGGVSVGSYAGTNAAPAIGAIVSGNVGIGTITPSSALDVRGSIMAGSGTGDATVASQGAQKLVLQTNGTNAIAV